MQLKNMLRVKMGWAHAGGPRNEFVLSSRVRLARNLADHNFPSRADSKTFAAVIAECFRAAEKAPSLAGAARIRLDELEPLERRFLVERHLISNLLAAKPKGRGVVVGEADRLSMMINEEDHLRLQGVDSGLCLPELLKKAGALDDDLSGELKAAFHASWGYLAACPTNTGTGLRASCLVHLPGLSLTGTINRVLEGLSRLGVNARGLYGEGTQVMGDLYQISNATALGRREEEIIERISQVVERLIAKEAETREEFVRGPQKLRLEDLIYRAVGTLSSARIISFEETMQNLSYLRLGLALRWKLPADIETVNELLVLAQPAHIQMLAGKELEPGDRDFLRATLLRRKIRGG